jgi:hypothetical protein
MSAPLAVGSQAPDFRLPATTGDTVSLSHYRGKRNLILVFYVGDNTPDCNRQHYSLWPLWDALERSVFERSECARVSFFHSGPGPQLRHRRLIGLPSRPRAGRWDAWPAHPGGGRRVAPRLANAPGQRVCFPITCSTERSTRSKHRVVLYK